MVETKELKAEPIYLEKHYDEYKMGNNNVFEEIVDMMMLDYFDDKFKQKIKDLPRRQKRMMILALLDKERNLFLRAKALIEDNIPKLKHLKDLILILREYVHVGETEKKALGEVMTPLELVKEMLATLPIDVWSNPDLKWLDSCNGTGPFLAMVAYRLMVGLAEWEPDEQKRYKHIMENMIYAGEYQAKNQFLWITLMDPYDEFNLNVYTGSFLDGGFDRHMKEVWKVEKFDIVVGNPPYQDNDENGRSKSGGNNLWSKFVNKAINILKDDNYLLYIHPSSWMSPSGNTIKDVDVKVNKYDLLHLEVETAKPFFEKVGSNFTWYLLKKSHTEGLKTKIKTLYDKKIYESKLDLKSYNYLPMFLCEEVMSIQNKFKSNKNFKFVIDYSFDQRKPFISKYESVEFKYPLYHTVKQVKFSSKKHPFQENKKILITKSGNLSPIYDKDGYYGTTETSAYHLVNGDNEGIFLLKLLNSKLYNFYLNVFKWSGFHNPLILNSLPIPDLSTFNTDEDLYIYLD